MLVAALGCAPEPTGGPAPPEAEGRQVVEIPFAPGTNLDGVWVDTDGTLFVVDDDGAVWTQAPDDDAWVALASDERLGSVARDATGALIGGVGTGFVDSSVARWEAGTWFPEILLENCAGPVLVRPAGALTTAACSNYQGVGRYPAGDGSQADLFGLTGAGESVADDVVTAAAGVFTVQTYARTIRQYTAGAWSDPASWPVVAAVDGEPYRAWSPDGVEVVVVGDGGALVWDGQTWSTEGEGLALRAVWGSVDDGTYAVGVDGGIARREDGWALIPGAPEETFRAIHGQPGGRIVAVGDHGAIVALE